ncbi:membrane protein [Bacteroidia bacterium]|nr:membrane protein [Bacteroidia bacterium]
MKKIFYPVVLLALASVAFFSCKDDENNSDKTPDVALSDGTTEQTRALVNAAYGPLQTLSSSYSFLVESATETTVSFEGADNAGGPLVSRFEVAKDNSYAKKLYNNTYNSIAAANTAIDKLTTLNSVDLTEDGRKLLISRAKFVRGYDYFQLVQLYGEVPLILSSNAATIATQNTTRKSIEDVYAQIVSDLTASIEGLPEWDANKSNPTQLAAKTVLAKVYLVWGQKPLTQEQVAAIATAKSDPVKPTVDNDKLKKAIDYADEVIKSGKYQLLSDYNKIWGVPNENNAEVIFSIHHEGDGIDAQGNHQTHCGFTFPSDERADSHIQYADITLEKLIPDGDARQLYSYLTDISYGDGNRDTLTWPLSVVRPGKWVHRDQDGVNFVTSTATQLNDIDHIDFRLAEVYLIKAEAQWYANDGDKGLAAVNALRSRAKVASLGSITEDAIQKEWGYEFAFEQKHWFNLVRWRTLIASIDKVKDYEYYKEKYNDENQFKDIVYNGVKADPTRFEFYKRIYEHLHSKTTNIDGHQYRFPIPLDANNGDRGEIIGQNPGY